jgi:DNA primase
MQIEKTDFRGALEVLADRAGVELTSEAGAARERSQQRRRVIELYQLAVQYYEYILHEHRAGEPGRSLLAERQVSEETARRFGLGYAPGGESFATFLRRRGRSLTDAVSAGLVRRSGQDFFEDRLVVPIRDEAGRPLAFTGRTIRKDEVRKYVNSPENPAYVKGRVLFGLDLAREEINRQGYAVLMEGQFDVIAGHQHDVQNAVASSGTALTEQQIRLLRRFTEDVMIVFDTDRAGREAAFKAIELASAQELRTTVASLPEGKDPDEFLRGAGAEAGQRWAQIADAALPGWEFWIKEAISDLNPSRLREFEIALKRVNDVLSRIPSPALRETYRERAANWLGVEPHLMEVKAQARPSRPARESESQSNGLPPGAPGKELSSELRYLIQVLAVRPEAAARLREKLDPDHLDGEERSAYLRMLQTVERGGADALQAELDGYSPEWQAAVSEAWTVAPPQVGDAVIDEVAGKLVSKSLRRRRRLLISQLQEAEASGDGPRIAQLETLIRTLGAARVNGESE